MFVVGKSVYDDNIDLCVGYKERYFYLDMEEFIVVKEGCYVVDEDVIMEN